MTKAVHRNAVVASLICLFCALGVMAPRDAAATEIRPLTLPKVGRTKFFHETNVGQLYHIALLKIVGTTATETLTKGEVARLDGVVKHVKSIDPKVLSHIRELNSSLSANSTLLKGAPWRFSQKDGIKKVVRKADSDNIYGEVENVRVRQSENYAIKLERLRTRNGHEKAGPAKSESDYDADLEQRLKRLDGYLDRVFPRP